MAGLVSLIVVIHHPVISPLQKHYFEVARITMVLAIVVTASLTSDFLPDFLPNVHIQTKFHRVLRYCDATLLFRLFVLFTTESPSHIASIGTVVGCSRGFGVSWYSGMIILSNSIESLQLRTSFVYCSLFFLNWRFLLLYTGNTQVPRGLSSTFPSLDAKDVRLDFLDREFISFYRCLTLYSLRAMSSKLVLAACEAKTSAER